MPERDPIGERQPVLAEVGGQLLLGARAARAAERDGVDGEDGAFSDQERDVDGVLRRVQHHRVPDGGQGEAVADVVIADAHQVLLQRDSIEGEDALPLTDQAADARAEPRRRRRELDLLAQDLVLERVRALEVDGGDRGGQVHEG